MRKEKIVTVPASGGRDAGKHFLITEFSALRAEKWATRALLALASSGMDIPPEVVRMGAGAIVAVGFRAMLTMAFADAEPLLSEMLQCVQVMPDKSKPDVLRPLDDEDIEEVSTLLLLRSEVIELHTGFSPADFLSTLGKSAAAPTPDSSDTPTSASL